MAYPEALPQIVAAAVAAERESGVPAVITAAQCAIESGWLDKAPGNNCFGVTWQPGAGDRQLLPTLEWLTAFDREKFGTRAEYEGEKLVRATGKTGKNRHGVATAEWRCLRWFRAYATLADSFRDHGKLISSDANYRAVWRRFQMDRNVEGLAVGIARSGYATSPNYEKLLPEVMKMTPLVRAILAERKLPPKKDSK